jgi:HTH-type transcriptional regulator/antitoxin HigA
MVRTQHKGISAVKPTHRYLDLIHQFPLRPIRSDAELDQAIKMIDSLLDRDDIAPDEEDYLDVLSDLVEKREDEHIDIPDVSGRDMLRHLIEARGVTQATVATETGLAASTVSEILKGKRGLSLKHIEALARYFRVHPGVFLPEPRRFSSADSTLKESGT